MPLDDIGVKYGTDKSSLRHNYLPLYEQHLEPIRYENLILLELGVLDGASLKMWRDYLPNTRVVGLDQHPPIHVDDCVVLQGEQDDPAAIALTAEYGPFDVIIDDASHLSSKTITSFQLLYPHLATNGLYVIEDLHSSYWDQIYGSAESNPNPDSGQQTAMTFCKRLADETNFDPHQNPPDEGPRWAIYPRRYWLGYHLESVAFHYGIAFIRKHRDARP